MNEHWGSLHGYAHADALVAPPAFERVVRRCGACGRELPPADALLARCGTCRGDEQPEPPTKPTRTVAL